MKRIGKILTVFQIVALTFMVASPVFADELITPETVSQVQAGNQDPDAVDDIAETTVGTSVSIAVLANDTDADGDTVALYDFGQGSNGEVSKSGSQLIYTPNAGFVGTDTFTYTIDDGKFCFDVATVTVTITGTGTGDNGGQNRNPVAADDSTFTDKNVPVTINVLSNDSDPDGDTVQIFDFKQASHGVVTQSGTQLVYTPANGFVGTDTFEYTIDDGKQCFDTALVTIEVREVADPTIPACLVDIKANGQDSLTIVEGNEFTVSWTSQNLTGSLTASGQFSGTKSGTGSEKFLAPNAGGYTFTLQGVNSKGVTCVDSVGVTAQEKGKINLPPVAVDDVRETSKNVALTINVLSNDSDPEGDAIFVNSHNATSQFAGTITKNSDGTLLYTPANGFVGTDTFYYTIADGNGGFDEAKVTITVKDVILPPGNALCSIDIRANGSDSLTVNKNTQFSIAWTSSNTSGGLTPEGTWSGSGAKQAQGSQNFQASAVGTYTFILHGVNADNKPCSDQVSIKVDDIILPPVNALCSIDIRANGSDSLTVEKGQTFDLSWTSSNTSGGLTPEGTWSASGIKATSGTQKFFSSAVGTYTFILHGVNADNKPCSDQVTVKVDDIIVPPGNALCSIDIRANGQESLAVYKGDIFELSWTSANTIKELTPEGSWASSGVKATSGTQKFQAANSGTYTFILHSINSDNKPCSDQVSVSVAERPVINRCGISLVTQNGTSDIQLKEGDNLVLSWTSLNISGNLTGASEPRLAAWDGNKSTSGSQTLSTSGLSRGNYIIGLTGSNGNNTCAFNVEVGITERSNGGGTKDPIDRRGGGGGGSRKRLRITNEKVKKSSEQCAIVTWDTNLKASSRVVYGYDSTKPDKKDDDYGYKFSTKEYDTDTKDHKLEICGLDFSKKVYFRPVSDRKDTPEVYGKELNLAPKKVDNPIDQCTLRLEDYMRIDFNNNPVEVLKLQMFLNYHMGESLQLNGVFDRATDAATRRFQVKYNDDVLNPWGYEDNESTGYVYITTKKKINEFLCGPDDILTSGNYNEIAAFRRYQDSLAARGISYAGPLVDGPWYAWAQRNGISTHSVPSKNAKVAQVGDRSKELAARGVTATGTPTTTISTVETPSNSSMIDRVDNDSAAGVTVLTQPDTEGSNKVGSALFSGVNGIMGFILSVPFLLLVLGILVGLLVIELWREHKRREVSEVTILK